MKVLLITCILVIFSCTNHEESNAGVEMSELHQPARKLSDAISGLVEENVRGFVLIHHSALQYRSIEKARADSSKPKSIVRFDIDHIHLHAPLFTDNPHLYNFGSNLVARKVLQDHGDVVEVVSLDDDDVVPEKLGHGGLGADYIFELKTFVRKIDLVPVLARSYKISFEDQTQIRFDPGVAVGIPWNSDEMRRAVSIRQLHFEFPIPDSLLALSYEPILYNLKDFRGKMMLDDKSNIFLNSKLFCPVSEIRHGRLRTAQTTQDNSDPLLVNLQSNGIGLTVRTDLELVKAYIPNIDRPSLTSKYKIPPRWLYRIPKGTEVLWNNGNPAGKVRQYFTYQSNAAPLETKWCEVITESLTNEQLCFRLKDIEVIENEVSDDQQY